MDGSVSGKLTNRREFDLGQSAILKARTSINPVISVSNISMRFGAKILFEEVSTAFLSGRCYGLSGPNGSGKSTFMKLLTGEMDAQKGTVVRPKRLGVLRQDQFAFDAFRVVDTVIMGNLPLWNALAERDGIYAKPDMTNEDGMRLGELEIRPYFSSEISSSKARRMGFFSKSERLRTCRIW